VAITRRLPAGMPALPMSAEEGHGYDAGLRRTVVPGVAGAVLDDAIAGFEMQFRAIIQFEIDFTRNYYIEIDGVRGVHGGIHGLENFGEAG